LVLEEEGEVIGYIITCVCHDLEKAVILRIAVHPDHRGKGAAGTLMRECLEMVKQKNIGEVELDVG
jgi:ribosomal protein S18 acetylase RimI-like enzyme